MRRPGRTTCISTAASEPAWDEPLVGFSRGDDPLYQRFKEDIGPFFWTPPEIFAATFPDVQAAPDELTVISWILPQTEQTRLDNSREKALPAETMGADRANTGRTST